MTHDQFQAHLSEYIDDELTRELRLEMEAHLQTCEDCRVLLVTTQKSIEISREHGPKLSEAFREQLTQEVQRAYKAGKGCAG